MMFMLCTVAIRLEASGRLMNDQCWMREPVCDAGARTRRRVFRCRCGGRARPRPTPRRPRAGDLHSFLKGRGGTPLGEAMVLDFFVQLALGLRHVHERRILHRCQGARFWAVLGLDAAVVKSCVCE